MGNVNVEREKFEVRETIENTSQIKLKIRFKGNGNKKPKRKKIEFMVLNFLYQ